MLAAGEMNRRVRFERKSVARDAAYGSEVITWVEVATVWAKVTEMPDTTPSGGERVQQDVKVYTARTQLNLRYRSGLSTDMRVVLIDRSRTLQIVSISETSRLEGLQVMCEDYSV